MAQGDGSIPDSAIRASAAGDEPAYGGEPNVESRAALEGGRTRLAYATAWELLEAAKVQQEPA